MKQTKSGWFFLIDKRIAIFIIQCKINNQNLFL
jgi:hypothetical protein